MDELAIYFKSTHIGKTIANKKPPFPIEMWKQYHAAGEGLAQTTNIVESWHYGLQVYFTGSTPNIWLLLRNLDNDSKMQKIKYIQETAGFLCPQPPPIQKNLKNRCRISESFKSSKMLCHNSEQLQDLDYIKNI